MGSIDKGRLVSAGISLGLLAGLLYLADVGAILSVLSRAELSYVLLGLGLWGLTVVLRVYRWRYLLRAVGIDPSAGAVTSSFLSGFYLANVTPAKTGDPVRSVLLRRTASVPIRDSLPSIAVERLGDLAALLVLAVLGVFVLPPSDATPYIHGAIGVMSLAALVVVYILTSRDRTHRVNSFLHRTFSFIPQVRQLEESLESFSETLSETFNRYGRVSHLLVLLTLSTAVWVAGGAIGKMAFLALGMDVPLHIMTVVLAISVLIGVASLLPGGLGSTEISGVLILTSLGTGSLGEVTAAFLLMRAMNYWMYVVAGSVVMATRIS